MKKQATKKKRVRKPSVLVVSPAPPVIVEWPAPEPVAEALPHPKTFLEKLADWFV